MSPTPNIPNDIEEQEENISNEPEDYEKDKSQSSFSQPPFWDVVKSKARQQLAVSVDSPFSKEIDPAEMRKLKEERAAMLIEETSEIRRQLELVKNRLNELKSSSGAETSGNNKFIDSSRVLNNSNKNNTQKYESKLIKKSNVESIPKYRPLTGRADCPNCVCDRRNSICDKCIGIAIIAPSNQHSSGRLQSKLNHSIIKENDKESTRQQQIITDPDERPIRPAKDKTLGTVVEILDDVVVPNKVYTISKSLNEKRSKLAQTIDELESLMDRVKEKEDRLDKERKIVKLYKEQWQYGPNIAGLPATSRDRLDNSTNNKRNYESRLDANLARDTKSLMGFQHVESGLKLRQYDNNHNNKPPFRRSMVTTTSKQNYPIRSRSLESLRTTAQKKKQHNILDKRTTISPRLINTRISNNNNRKSSSEINLSTANTLEPKINNKHTELGSNLIEQNTISDDQRNEDEEVEEILDESIVDVDREEGQEELDNNNNSNTIEDSNNKKKMQKMTWIPVFGETEIKQVKLTTPKRKVQIVSPDNNKDDNLSMSSSPIRGQHQTSNINSFNRSNFKRQDLSLVNRRPNNSSNNDSISNYNILTGAGGSDARSRNVDSMKVARQTLKAATSLLEQEQRDSKTKNQLIIRKRTIAPTMKHKPLNDNNLNNSNLNKETTTSVKSIATPTDKEIARLEEKVNEQQKLLERLANTTRERTLVSPVTVTCSSPCCHFQQLHNSGNNQTRNNNNINQLNSFSPTNKQLINTLRDRLQKTKLRLTKTLEDELHKHNQLKESVDCSLKKQTNLENQNELLKQSLNKCLDKCLKDLSNTFEYLSDNLNNSAIISRTTTTTSSNVNGKDNSDNVYLISNATQLMKENKHLKQMKNHIETIECQRKVIFEELSKEKQRSNELESKLKQNQNELKQLMEAKQKLESQLVDISSSQNKDIDKSIDIQDDKIKDQSLNSENKQVEKTLSNKPTTSFDEQSVPIATTSNNNRANNRQDTSLNNHFDNADKSDLDDSYNSIDLYRRYVQSMSPDIESIKRERKLIIKEFDNIKKMLTDIEK